MIRCISGPQIQTDI